MVCGSRHFLVTVGDVDLGDSVICPVVPGSVDVRGLEIDGFEVRGPKVGDFEVREVEVRDFEVREVEVRDVDLYGFDL